MFAPLGIFARFCTPIWARQKALLKLGLPMGLSYLIEVTSYTLMALFISHLGTTVLAGHQIAGNLGAVLYMTPLSIGIAASTLVARALGAGRSDEARLLARHGVMFAGMTAIGYACVVLLLRHAIIDGYTPNPDVMAAALPLVTIVALYHCVDAVQVSTAFVLRAYKVAVVPTVIYAVALSVGRGRGRRLPARLRYRRLGARAADGRARLLERELREPADRGHGARALSEPHQPSTAARRGLTGRRGRPDRCRPD
ncbi:MAG: Multidrug resistance protein NorM [Burkholderia gladioli]|nr:MAG: Multidrug resistance protein NorM [Burkholderia gladioli]